MNLYSTYISNYIVPNLLNSKKNLMFLNAELSTVSFSQLHHYYLLHYYYYSQEYQIPFNFIIIMFLITINFT